MTAVHNLPAVVQVQGNNDHDRPHVLIDVNLGTVLYDEDPPPEKKERLNRTAASTTSLSTGVYASDHLYLDAIQPIVLVLLTHLLEALERLHAALATAEVRIVGGSILIIYEGDLASAEKVAQTPEDVPILNGKATSEGKVEDEETIAVQIDEHGHHIVDDVVAGTTNEGGDEESRDDDEPHLFRLSLIFAHTRLVPDKNPT
ncbi:hypothetical protein EDD15DRAFT_2191460 [Pisolithus albus]|nr:hypothetical protein EDD15DRAFT_2191460 [Pisolithus albus]